MGSDIEYIFIGLPLVGAIVLTALSNKIEGKSKYIKPWFQPSESVYGIIWCIVYLILGILIWKSRDTDDDTLYWMLVGLVLLSYFWIYSFVMQNEMRVAFYTLGIMVTLSFIILVELFYSNITEDDSPDAETRLYIFMFCGVIGWLIFIMVLCSQVTLREMKLEKGGESPFPRLISKS